MGKTPHLTASKVLEKVVCIQMTEFLEKNNLLPKSQHGFRAKHSTMTAHSNMQTDWVENSENGQKTGLLIWDILHITSWTFCVGSFFVQLILCLAFRLFNK